MSCDVGEVTEIWKMSSAERGVRQWQCIPLPFGNDYAHTVLVSSMFALSVTEVNSQPNVVGPYEQVYRSQKVCVSGPMFIGLFVLVFVGTTTSQNILHLFLTHCIMHTDLKEHFSSFLQILTPIKYAMLFYTLCINIRCHRI